MHADYSGQGYDQLADVIKKIRYTPDDRRILLSAWNPADLKLMALPPCHMFAQVNAPWTSPRLIPVSGQSTCTQLSEIYVDRCPNSCRTG